MSPVNFHILKLYPTLNYCDEANVNKEYLFIVMEQPSINLKSLENISYHFTDFKIIKSYILMIFFSQIINSIGFDDQPFSEHTIFYTQDHDLVSFGPEIQPYTLQWLNSDGIVKDLINEYKFELLYVLKEWYQSLKASKGLAVAVKNIYQTVNSPLAC